MEELMEKLASVADASLLYNIVKYIQVRTTGGGSLQLDEKSGHTTLERLQQGYEASLDGLPTYQETLEIVGNTFGSLEVSALCCSLLVGIISRSLKRGTSNYFTNGPRK